MLLFSCCLLIRDESSCGHKIDGTKPTETGNKFVEKIAGKAGRRRRTIYKPERNTEETNKQTKNINNRKQEHKQKQNQKKQTEGNYIIRVGQEKHPPHQATQKRQPYKQRNTTWAGRQRQGQRMNATHSERKTQKEKKGATIKSYKIMGYTGTRSIATVNCPKITEKQDPYRTHLYRRKKTNKSKTAKRQHKTKSHTELLLFISYKLINYDSSCGHSIDRVKPKQTRNEHGRRNNEQINKRPIKQRNHTEGSGREKSLQKTSSPGRGSVL